MANYYVSVDGSDEGNGTEGDPWRTVQRAIAQARSGDNVYVGVGEYDIGELLDIPLGVSLIGVSEEIIDADISRTITRNLFQPILVGSTITCSEEPTTANWTPALIKNFELRTIQDQPIGKPTTRQFNSTCKFFSGDKWIPCAVHPKGSCEGCVDFESLISGGRKTIA